MPIIDKDNDIIYYLSGGASNSDPNASLGGAISSTALVSASSHNLYDIVTGAETSAGAVEYRCVYVKNNHPTLTAIGAKLYVLSNTPSTSTNANIGLGTSAINGVEQTIADELTAPIGVVFSAPSTFATGLLIGDIPPGGTKAIWYQRIITAGATAFNGDNVIARLSFDSATT